MPIKAPWDESYGDERINIVTNQVLACRVPLDPEKYKADGWTVDAMLAKARSILNPVPKKLLVLNLSATDKYYTPIDDKNVEFAHMLLRGRTVPSAQDVAVFIKEMDEAILAGKGVIVHCTHGLNRTGFMLCKWLMHSKGWTASQAQEYFAVVRPPGIMRDNIKDGLLR
jgi:atypical dual specificity phosphatase